MVRFAALQIRADKRLAGSNTTDVMSRANRGRHDYRLTSLPHSDDEEAAPEAHDGLKARIPDAAESGRGSYPERRLRGVSGNLN